VHTCREALAATADWGWPIVLKPQTSHKLVHERGIDSFQVTYAESPEDLRREFARLEGRCGVLLQRYCRGVGQGVELLMSRGRPLAAFQHRRRRELPLSGGASSYRESVPLDPELYGHAGRLLAALEWTGLAMVEFKVGDEGAELMEINGRVWGSLPLAVACGMDFPRLLAQLCLEGEESVTPRLAGDYTIGLHCRDLGRDLLWIAAVLGRKQRYGFLPPPPRRRAVRALLGILDPRRRMDLLTADDPLPGLLELPRLAPRLWSKVQQEKTSRSGWARGRSAG
jgi:predicted ATP-grasp superfamily ATP-dependent carboligase